MNATTLHALFDLDGETYQTKLDFSQKSQRVIDILSLDVLLMDEVSMIDVECFQGRPCYPPWLWARSI